MSKVDILFIIVVFICLFIGYRQGIVGIVISLASVITAGIIIHRQLFVPLLQQAGVPEPGMWHFILPPLVFTLCFIIGFLLRKAIEKILKLTFTHWINKTIGALIGAIAGLIIMLTLFVFGFTGDKNPLFTQQDMQSSRFNHYAWNFGSRF